MDLMAFFLELLCTLYLLYILYWLVIHVDDLSQPWKDILFLFCILIFIHVGDVLGRIVHLTTPFVYSALLSYAVVGLVWVTVKLCKRRPPQTEEILEDFEIGDV